MPFKDKEKRRSYALEMYYKHKEEWKQKFNSLPEEEKERRIELRRIAHNKSYNKHKAKIKEKRKLTHDKIRLKHAYNLTLEEYYKILESQNGKCAICGRERAAFKNMKLPLCVDHDHSTKKIRGLLCESCNIMIGLAKDNREILLNAVKYLENGER